MIPMRLKIVLRCFYTKHQYSLDTDTFPDFLYFIAQNMKNGPDNVSLVHHRNVHPLNRENDYSFICLLTEVAMQRPDNIVYEKAEYSEARRLYVHKGRVLIFIELRDPIGALRSLIEEPSPSSGDFVLKSNSYEIGKNQACTADLFSGETSTLRPFKHHFLVPR
jgi:hypothetical protein